MIWEDFVCAKQLSPCAATVEPVLCHKGSHRNEKPVHHNEEMPLLATTREKSTKQQRASAAENKSVKLLLKIGSVNMGTKDVHNHSTTVTGTHPTQTEWG